MSVRQITRTYNGVTREEWVVDYTDSKGKRRQKKVRTETEGKDFEAKVRLQKKKGTHIADSASVTISKACDLFLEEIDKRDLEPCTKRTYRATLKNHVRPFLGPIKVTKLTTGQLRQFKDDLRKGAQPKKGEKTRMILAAKSSGFGKHKNAKARKQLEDMSRSEAIIKKTMTVLTLVVGHAQDLDLVSHNVCVELSGRAGHRRSRNTREDRQKKLVGVDYPTPDEMQRILAALHRPLVKLNKHHCFKQTEGRWIPFIKTLVFTGMRISEICALQWSDIDLDAKTIHVHQKCDGQGVIGEPKTSCSNRTFPIVPPLVPILREWKEDCPKGPLGLAFPNRNGHAFLYPNIHNKKYSEWKRAQIAAGICVVGEDGEPAAKYPGFHAIRHFFASWCLNPESRGGRDIKPQVVSKWLGHSSIAQTCDIYGHLFIETDGSDDAETTEAVNKLMTPKLSLVG